MTEKKALKPDYSKAGKMKGIKAKKSHKIKHNTFEADIKSGQDLEKIPDMFHQTLKTEGVI